MMQASSQQGFSLLQIGILLTVASLVMVNLLPSSQMKLNNNSITTARLNGVMQALRNFESANGRMPCPADATQPIGGSSYGKEAANYGTTNNCSGGSPAANYIDATNHIAIGMVPVRTLALGNDYALDGYSHDITYAVDTNATVCGWGSNPLTGGITVTDNGKAANSVTALVSHGADGHGAWIPMSLSTGTAVRLNAGATDTDELTNAHVDSSFTPTATLTNFVRKTPTATFDDVVAYKSSLWNLNQLPAAVPQIVTVTPPSNGGYSTGQALTFVMTFGSSVTVTGTPRLTLTIGANTRYANYASGSGTNSLTFSYTIVAGDSAPNGISMTSSIAPNGGTILSGNACAYLGFSTPSLASVVVNSGYLLIADNYNRVIREVSLTTGIITTVAGVYGMGDYAGDGGPALSAHLSWPGSVTMDSQGNLYWGGYYDNDVRKVTAATGIISRVAGIVGSAGFSGDGGAATSAQLNQPGYVAVDSSGNIYFTDQGNYRVRKVTVATGIITTYAGTGSGGYNGDNIPATSATLSNALLGLTIDSNNNLYISDGGNGRIRKVTAATGIITTVIGNGSCCFTADGQLATNTEVWWPSAPVSDSAGNLYYTDDWSVRKVSAATNLVSTVAGTGTEGSSGNGGLATSAAISPCDVAVDASGNLYISDCDPSYNYCSVRKVTAATGIISTAVGTNGSCNYTGDGGPAVNAQIGEQEWISVGNR